MSDALPGQLRPYVRDGRISVMPAKRAARLVLLDRVAQGFEPGLRYSEPAVNEILKAVFDDYAALRRYLIDEGLLSRTPGGTYWRSGGTVPIGPDQEGPGGQGDRESQGRPQSQESPGGGES